MPHNDYDDPELSFPRLEARVVKTDDDAFHIQIWKWVQAGERELKPIFSGKKAGSYADIRAFLAEVSEEQGIDISPDDVEWPDVQ